MDSHRVYLIWIHPLFLESLRLLLQSANIQWAGSSHCSEIEYAEIHRLNPDTILVEEEENGSVPASVIDLFQNSSKSMRVFRLSLADNDLMIYHRERRTVMQAEDLLSMIVEPK